MSFDSLRPILRGLRNRLSIRRYGHFPYFGERICASRDSEIVRRIAREAIFEQDILEAIQLHMKPNTCFLDVGANIGAMSIPVLQASREVTVLSVECSPSTFPFLRQTHALAGNDRWQLDQRAVSLVEGTVVFHTSGADMGAYDGLQHTGRGGSANSVLVQSAPLDRIWTDHGSPPVSVLKIDIEGGEFEALMSGAALIESQKPAIIFEWAAANLGAYNRDPMSIFDIVERFPGELIALPSLLAPTRGNLGLLLKHCEMFLLMPD
jgi:FkbM family methyltransferase